MYGFGGTLDGSLQRSVVLAACCRSAAAPGMYDPVNPCAK
jgi:hypothetical protein